MSSAASLREIGIKTYLEVMTVPPTEVSDPAQDAHLEFVFGEIWSRPVLSRTDRRWITLSCVAASDAPESMENHVYAALNSGDITYAELLEGALHFSVYVGWAKGLQLNRVIHQQWARIHQERGLEMPAPTKTHRFDTADDAVAMERARTSYRSVNAVDYVPPPIDPFIEIGVVGYIFGRMWTRPGLDVRARRMITLACVGVSDAHIPVQSHVYAALASGDLTIEEIREVVLQFAAYAGWPKGSFLSITVEQQYGVLQQGADGPNLS